MNNNNSNSNSNNNNSNNNNNNNNTTPPSNTVRTSLSSIMSPSSPVNFLVDRHEEEVQNIHHPQQRHTIGAGNVAYQHIFDDPSDSDDEDDSPFVTPREKTYTNDMERISTFLQACSEGRVDIVEWCLGLKDYGDKDNNDNNLENNNLDNNNNNNNNLISSSSPEINNQNSSKSVVIDVNVRDKMDDSSGLHKAAASGHLEVMKVLISCGAQVEARDNISSTPLHWAASNNQAQAVSILLSRSSKRRADGSNIRDLYGYAPLHLAIKREYFDVADTLLLFGADINFKKSDGSTALHHACAKGQITSVEYLVDHHAMLNLRDQSGDTPMLSAVRNNQTAVVHFLIQRKLASLSSNPSHATATAMASVSWRNLNSNANPSNSNTNRQDKESHVISPHKNALGMSSSHDLKAVMNTSGSHMNMNGVSTLLQATDNSGCNIMHLAAQENHAEIIKTVMSIGNENLALLDLLTDLLNAADKTYLFTPLHFAVKNGSTQAFKEIVMTNRYLGDRAIDFDYRDKDGNTPLHIALMREELDMAVLLFVEGASDDIKNNAGDTAKKLCRKNGLDLEAEAQDKHDALAEDCEIIHPDMERETLEEREAQLHKACADGDILKVLLIVRKKTRVAVDEERPIPGHDGDTKKTIRRTRFISRVLVDVNCRDPITQSTPLHKACETGHLEIVHALIKNGADVNTKTGMKSTPLHTACRYGNVDAVNVLTKHGALLNTRDWSGDTPLLVAAKEKKIPAMRRMLELMAEQGCPDGQHPLLVRGKMGHNLMHIAAKYGHLELVKLVVSRLRQSEWVELLDERDVVLESTPLHVAAMHNHRRVMEEFLLLHGRLVGIGHGGVDIDAQDMNGNTALHVALEREYTKMAEILIRNGSRMDVKNFKRKTPRKMCKKQGIKYKKLLRMNNNNNNSNNNNNNYYNRDSSNNNINNINNINNRQLNLIDSQIAKTKK